MHTEFEARFLNVNGSQLRKILRKLGAKREFDQILMRRVIFGNEALSNSRGWLRLRDEGNRASLTLKHRTKYNDIRSVEELEILLDPKDFLKVQELLELLGLSSLRYQENLRESWRLENSQITLDKWPSLPEFVEIEGPSEQIVNRVMGLLGLDPTNVHFGSVDEVYLLEGINILEMKSLRFSEGVVNDVADKAA